MIVRFGEFELDLDCEELSVGGEVTSLAPQPAKVLALLVASAGRTVSRQAIQEHVWGDDHVEADVGLNSCIRKIRAELGDDPNEPRFIRTFPRRGYRFVAEVKPLDLMETAAEASSARTHRSPVRWGLTVAAAVLALGAIVLFEKEKPVKVESAPPTTSAQAVEPRILAVLPFVDLSETPRQEYLGAGLTEETIARLGTLAPETLSVIARSTAVAAQQSGRDSVEIARDLGASHLLEGSVRRHDGTFRTTVRLVDTTTGVQWAAETYEASTGDLLESQATVADRIGRWVTEQFEIASPGSVPSSDVPPAVYDAYLKGLHALHRATAEGYRESRRWFGEVVESEPGSARGWTGVAEAELWSRWFGAEDPDGAVQRSRTAAARAIELDERLPGPHLLLGYAAMYVDFDLAAAGAHLARAADLAPGNARAQSWYAAFLSAAGRHDEAVERARLARRLDPLAMAVRADLCWLLNYARRFDEALAACSHALDLQPRSGWSAMGKIEALRQLGRTTDALAVVEALGAEGELDVPRLTEGSSRPLDPLWGWFQRRLEARAAQGFPHAYAAASLAALRERPEEALDWLEKAWESGDLLVVFAGVDPRFDGLRKSPRYTAMMAKLNLPVGAEADWAPAPS